MKLKNLTTGLFLLCILTAVPGFCFTADELVEQGKTALIEDKDLYAADAKFIEALALEPVNEKANFWRAVTIISSNPSLKQRLIDLEIIDNVDNKPLVFDKEDNLKNNVTPVDTIIIDNKDTGYFEVGSGWQTVTPPNKKEDTAYDVDYRACSAGTGSNVAAWIPAITVAGEYNVDVWWPYASNNAWNARFTVYYDGGSKTIIKNQRTDYDRWATLGKFKFTPGQQARVELSDNTLNGQVAADAVMFEFDGEYLPEAQAVLTGSWQAVVKPGAGDGSYIEITAGSGGSCQWQLNIPQTGKCQIEAYWLASPGNASDAVFTIAPSGSAQTQVSVNQNESQTHFVTANLGIYEFQAGTGSAVTVSQSANGKVTTDGIRITAVRSNYPNLTEAQADLNDSLAEVDQALVLLGNVTNGFQDTADFHANDASGNPILTELDYGDALMLKAQLNLQKSNINMNSAYDLDNIDAPELATTYEGLLSVNYVLDKYLNLGKLTVDASVRLTNAKLALIEGINRYLDAYNFIIVEMDPQDDDFITFEARDRQETNYVNSRLAELKENLEGQRPSITLTIDDASKMGMDKHPDDSYGKVTANLAEFFDNPKNTRGLKPQFGSDDRPIRSTTPDPTLGGIFPNTTQAELNGYYQLGSYLYQPVTMWQDDGSVLIKLQWDKDTYTDFVSYKIYRSTTDDVNESSVKVYDSADQNILWFIDTTADFNQRIYYYRLYTYYSDGDVTAGMIKRVITKVYVGINNTSGVEDGSPQNPYKFLRDAVENTSSGKILVAQGTYNESEVTLGYLRNLNNAVFEGGYEAVNWSRDVLGYPAIIDGAGLSGYSVISIYNKNNIVIDGFTLKGTQSRIVQINRSTAIGVKNCIIKDNQGTGIAVYYNSSVVIKTCEISNNRNEGIYISNPVSVEISGCLIKGNLDYSNRGRGIELGSTYSRVTIKNNLIENNSISCMWDDSPAIINNTIAGGAYGIEYPYNDYYVTPIIKNNIITGTGTGIYLKRTNGAPVIDYNDVWNNTINYSGCSVGANDISADPSFAAGPIGSYYLSQIAAGQAADSPCIDAGSDTAVSLGLQDLTTRTDREKDSGAVDIGYHYFIDNNAPILDVIGDKIANEHSGNKVTNENDVIRFTISAVDPDRDALTYSADNLPGGATFDPATKEFYWQPDYNVQSGRYPNVAFTVSDGSMAYSESITIIVNRAPRIAFTPIDMKQPAGLPVLPDGLYAAYVGEPFQARVEAVDPEADIIKELTNCYYIAGTKAGFALPKNATFALESNQNGIAAGAVTFTPAADQLHWSYNFLFGSSDKMNATAFSKFNVQVYAEAAINLNGTSSLATAGRNIRVKGRLTAAARGIVVSNENVTIKLFDKNGTAAISTTNAYTDINGYFTASIAAPQRNGRYKLQAAYAGSQTKSITAASASKNIKLSK